MQFWHAVAPDWEENLAIVHLAQIPSAVEYVYVPASQIASASLNIAQIVIV